MRSHPLLVALGLLLASSSAAVSAGPFPLELVEPETGAEVRLEPDAEVLHVVFFATWCPTCLDELDRLALGEARWGERGYRLVVIAVKTRHTAARLRSFSVERRPPGRLLFDATGDAARALGNPDLPTHVLYDRTGRELHRCGSVEDGIEEALARTLGGRDGRQGGE